VYWRVYKEEQLSSMSHCLGSRLFAWLTNNEACNLCMPALNRCAIDFQLLSCRVNHSDNTQVVGGRFDVSFHPIIPMLAQNVLRAGRDA
jgi:hypothetical protein